MPLEVESRCKKRKWWLSCEWALVSDFYFGPHCCSVSRALEEAQGTHKVTINRRTKQQYDDVLSTPKMNYSSTVSAASSSTSSSSSSSSGGGGTTTSTSRSTHSGSGSGGGTALQSLVRTKCWSIAPLWKFVTYELEQRPNRTPKSNFARSSSVRNGAGGDRGHHHPRDHHQRKVKISYENSLSGSLDMLQNPHHHHHHHGVMPPKRRWSKPHPQQSFAATSATTKSHHSFGNSSNHRQPLKQTNHRPLDAVVEEKQPPPVVISVEEPPVEEWKPCGVLKKPGSYRGHASLKKVAFLENTELNRSTLWFL